MGPEQGLLAIIWDSLAGDKSKKVNILRENRQNIEKVGVKNRVKLFRQR